MTKAGQLEWNQNSEGFDSMYFVWLVVLFAKGLRAGHALNWPKSVLLAVIALVAYQGAFLIFNR